MLLYYIQPQLDLAVEYANSSFFVAQLCFHGQSFKQPVLNIETFMKYPAEISENDFFYRCFPYNL